MARSSEESASGNSAPRKKSLPAIIGGAVVVLVAGYFGIDLTSGGSGDSNSASSDNSAASAEGEAISSDSDTCAISSLPDEAHETRDDIVAGGPYEYPENDNRHFGNYEGVLPDQSSDFYREYTVETPGLDHRGARRIVTGGGSETDPEVWYYTDDHYESFCEIPKAKTNADGSINRKYGAYDEDAHILTWLREGHTDDRPSMEAQAMDWSDDIAYSVHDVEDGIVSGRISLNVLWDLVELANLADKGAKAFGGTAEELLDAADSLRQLPIVSNHKFDYTLKSYVDLKKMTSELVGRYVGATVAATKESGTTLGRQHGQLVVPPAAEAEVRLLKTIAVLYVMDTPAHLRRQDRQRERVYRVFDYLTAGAPGTLDAMFRMWWEQANSPAERQRVIIDQIASMTESRLERVARASAEFSGYLG